MNLGDSVVPTAMIEPEVLGGGSVVPRHRCGRYGAVGRCARGAGGAPGAPCAGVSPRQLSPGR